MTARPSLGELADEVVHRGLGADVDALGRLVEDDHLRLSASHLAMTTFCWLPPESSPSACSQLAAHDRAARRACASLALGQLARRTLRCT